MELSGLERAIMEYAKQTDYHGTLQQFLKWNREIDETAAIEALRGLKRKHLISMPPDLLNSWIGVTNAGHKRMGWTV